MRKYFLQVAVAALLTTTVSCEKEIMVKNPPYEPTLVVNGSVYVGDIPTVFVSKSVGVTDYNLNKKLWVDNARVMLYKGDNIIDSLGFESATGAYVGHIPVEPGPTYRIEVNAPGFERISALEKAPSSVPLKSVVHIKNARLSGYGDIQDEIRISFDDPAATKDYYILGLDMYDAAADSAVLLECVNTTDASVESIYEEEIESTTCLNASEIFFRDELFNGSTREMRFFVSSKNLERMGAGGMLTVSLHHVSESYFRYRKSFLFASENAGNPFSEPVKVHTNVSGGYGIFGVLNADYRTIN